MNAQQTSIRSCLLIKTVSALLIIQINGLPVAQWPVTRYVTSWLQKGRHSGRNRQENRQTNH